MVSAGPSSRPDIIDISFSEEEGDLDTPNKPSEGSSRNDSEEDNGKVASTKIRRLTWEDEKIHPFPSLKTSYPDPESTSRDFRPRKQLINHNSVDFESRRSLSPKAIRPEDARYQVDLTPPPEPELSFSSREVKSLSKARIEKTRLCDIIQFDQARGILQDKQGTAFIAYVQENDESKAPISISNLSDDFQPCPNFDFAYTNHYVLNTSQSSDDSPGCDCEDDECDPKTCRCYQLHEELGENPWKECWESRTDEFGQTKEVKVESKLRGDFAYDQAGKLRDPVVDYARTPIWECNDRCKCTSECRNRVVGKGRQVPVDVFKTKRKGWGLRTRTRLEKGTFIGIYAGELLDPEETEKRGNLYDKTNTSYVLDIEFFHIRRNVVVNPYVASLKARNLPIPEDDDELEAVAMKEWEEDDNISPELSIDAGLWGNLCRYLNHSCDPNLSPYPIYIENRDIMRPYVAFFTNRAVEAETELSFFYAGTAGEDEVDKSDDNVRKALVAVEGAKAGEQVHIASLRAMKCHCGSYNCKGRVFM